MTIARALVSVSDKTGLTELGEALTRHQVQIIASGGTRRALEQAGIPVLSVSQYTGAPEILDGRVKTLHPKVHGGILARATPEHLAQIQQQGMALIDLVVVNLYPFVRTIRDPQVSEAEAIEQIDIGGPTLIRSAAKNHERVTVVVDPQDYAALIAALEAGEIPLAMRRRCAAKAFAHTAGYDAAISNYFQQRLQTDAKAAPAILSLQLTKQQDLRYGENPHQQGGFYLPQELAGIPRWDYQQLAGTELSYNNFLDADGAWALVQELPGTAACIIKHTNPCGVASVDSENIAEAFRRARATDPVSAFGGIVAVNRPVSEELAQELQEIFLEVVIAPEFSPAALELLKRKKKLRLLRCAINDETRRGWRLRSAWGGILVQRADDSYENLTEARIVSPRPPTTQELTDLQLAWVIGKHVKSNAIVFVRDGQLLGVGAGQMSRVDSVKLAVSKAQFPLQGAVVASDAFFPFRDGLDAAAQAGATAVVEPGGSVRDEEVIAAAAEQNVALLFTGVRHFRH